MRLNFDLSYVSDGGDEFKTVPSVIDREELV